MDLTAEDYVVTRLAEQATTVASILDNGNTTDAAASFARSKASETANDAIQQWLGQFGTVQAKISLNENASLENSSIDWLLPMYETAENLLFTQLGARNKDDRNTLNAGLGVRRFIGGWMFGANGFYDVDVTGDNRRYGIGLETWRDYLQISANGYFRLSQWHQSRNLADYDERPANGYDIRANGWLPTYPQLGGKLIYEKYIGDEVVLFSDDVRQKDPYAFTAGVSWTPFPLITVGLDQRLGKGQQHDTSINLQFTWEPSKPWNSQISPDNVAGMRQLSGSRYALVDRNNNIVLEYRKQELIRMTLSSDSIQDVPGAIHGISAQVNSKYPLEDVTWDNATFLAAGGIFSKLSTTQFSLILPAWQPPPSGEGEPPFARNMYILKAIAVDTNGNRSEIQELHIEVLPPKVSFNGELGVSGDGAPADGKTPITVTATLTDSLGKPVAGQKVTMETVFADGSRKVSDAVTNSQGKAAINITSAVAGAATVTATHADQSQNVKVNFSTNAHIAAGNLVIVTDNALADGTATNSVKVKVTDASGNALAGPTVSFSATNGAVIAATGTTDAAGEVTVTLTSTTAGVSTVTASINSSSQTVDVKFVGFPSATTTTVSVSKTAIVGNGMDVSVATATVRDAAGTHCLGNKYRSPTVLETGKQRWITVTAHIQLSSPVM